MKLLYSLFVFLGIVSLFYSGLLLYKHFTPGRLTFSSLPKTQVRSTNQLQPVRLDIPSLRLSLAIFPAKITDHVWETTDKGVSYLSSSVIPGAKGNSILYGHNYTNILGTLPAIKPGAKLMITFADGEKKIFIVETTAVIAPTDDSILKPSEHATVTIYTCTGFLDNKRFVAKAIPQI